MKDNKNQNKILNSKINDFKSQLTDAIEECNAVYITSHKDPDFDAIASMGAMGLICKKLKKSPYFTFTLPAPSTRSNSETNRSLCVHQRLLGASMRCFVSSKYI